MNGSVKLWLDHELRTVQPPGVPAELADQLSDRFAAPHTSLEGE